MPGPTRKIAPGRRRFKRQEEDLVINGLDVADAGAVNVLYGGPNGLAATGNEFLYQGGPDIADAAEAGDRFGFALASGDFNADGFGDLAVGVPGQKVGFDNGAGAVHVFYGSPQGLMALTVFGAAVSDVVWHRDSAGVLPTADPGDNFGWALTSADFNGDGYRDLAIGVPYDDPVRPDAGSVHVLHGSSAGIVASDLLPTPAVSEEDQVWHQDVGAISTVAEPDDHFGWAVAAGDFDGDGAADLAIGVPGESVGPGTEPAWNAGPEGAGAIVVLEGAATGLTDANEAWHQATPLLAGLPDTAEPGDAFGLSLAAGDLNGDGHADLVVGVPYEDIVTLAGNNVANAGAVNVFYGRANDGLSLSGTQFWHQDSAGVADANERHDHFGGGRVLP